MDQCPLLALSGDKVIAMSVSQLPRRIEGYAIVSEDGMLANSAGVMPDSLKFKADQAFFERGLDGVDVIVHGRHSHEQQRHSDLRLRLILTYRIPTLRQTPPTKRLFSGIPPAPVWNKPWRCWACRTAASG